MSLRCSVVICSYDRPTILRETLSALYPLIHGKGEIIVVEQGASRDSATPFKNLPDVRYYNLTKPNMVEARNFGILKANYEIVIFLDDDIKPFPTLIEGHLSAYQDTKVGGVAGKIIKEGKHVVLHNIDYQNVNPALAWLHIIYDKPDRADVTMARGCNMSFRRKLLLQIGGFDTNFHPPFSFREDSDVSARIRALGYRIIFEPTAALIHLDMPTGGTRREQLKTNFLTNELLMYYLLFCHWRDNLFFIYKHFRGFSFLKNVAQAYCCYVGLSRWPWRLIAKNIFFLIALCHAWYLSKISKPPYFKPNYK